MFSRHQQLIYIKQLSYESFCKGSCRNTNTRKHQNIFLLVLLWTVSAPWRVLIANYSPQNKDISNNSGSCSNTTSSTSYYRKEEKFRMVKFQSRACMNTENKGINKLHSHSIVLFFIFCFHLMIDFWNSTCKFIS